MTELDNLFEMLRKNSLSIYDYEKKIRSGEIAKKGILEDDFQFENKNPDHPLASSNRSKRIDAADELFKSLVIKRTPITENQFSQLHEALFDCCASVRLVVSQIVGNIGNENSISALDKLVKDEKESPSVTQSALEAVKVLKGELKVNDGSYIRTEIVYCA